MEMKNVYSCDINVEVEKLKMLSGLLIGLDGKSVDLSTDEVNALGFILNDIANTLKGLNTDGYILRGEVRHEIK